MTIGLAVIGFALVGCQQAPPPAAQAPAGNGGWRDVRRRWHRSRHTRRPDAFHTVSPEAQKYLEGLTHRSTASEPLEDRRKRTDEWRVKQSAEAKRLFPVKVEETTRRACAPTSSPRSMRRPRIAIAYSSIFTVEDSIPIPAR